MSKSTATGAEKLKPLVVSKWTKMDKIKKVGGCTFWGLSLCKCHKQRSLEMMNQIVHLSAAGKDVHFEIPQHMGMDWWINGLMDNWILDAGCQSAD
jgi:hypothetical protein